MMAGGLRLEGWRNRVIAASFFSFLAVASSTSAQNSFPANGNVGIGTSSPNVQVDIRGSASTRTQMTISDGDTSSAMIRAGEAAATAGVMIG